MERPAPPANPPGRLDGGTARDGRLDAGTCQLLVVDVQAGLAAALPAAERDRALAALGLLATAAGALGVPATLTEHVPARIGSTVDDVRRAFAEAAVIEKVHFCAAAEPALPARLRAFDRPLVVVAGMETHVCVLQTALALQDQGFAVHLCVDACGARHPLDAAIARERAAARGIVAVTSDMVAFEWLRRADHPARRTVIEAVKAKGAV